MRVPDEEQPGWIAKVRGGVASVARMPARPARTAGAEAAARPPVLSSAPVLRRLFFLVFAVFLVQETSLGSLFLGAECVETCPDDTSPGHCPPTCATCSCGTHVSPVSPEATRLASPVPAPVPSPRSRRPPAPADRHVGEILHVPKPALA